MLLKYFSNPSGVELSAAEIKGNIKMHKINNKIFLTAFMDDPPGKINISEYITIKSPGLY
jgi:hypothetical protein